ncbi:hypothetical protein I4U23_022666 [Adineta vaga]|nr:hypothetical protein I4U23_022666 [Adineta vaga]
MNQINIQKFYLFLIFIGILLILNLYKLQRISSIKTSNKKLSRWKKDRLVIIPAIYKEIDWLNHTKWPSWLRYGLDLFNKNRKRSYDVYLYQRLDPNSNSPFNWPYCKNVHEESGVYLKFIYDFYHDLPDKMLFIHAEPFKHSFTPIEAAHCIRDDVYYTTINDLWIQNRPWVSKLRDPIDNHTLIYNCAKYILSLFGFDGDSQLNPHNIQPKEHSLISAMCCAQFYVRKERILHYTYEQWSSVYNASLQPYCTSPLDQELPGGVGMKWFGGSLEFLWHVILGLYPTYMLPPKERTTTDLCHSFRSSCSGSLCRKIPLRFLIHELPNSNKSD